jgi:hypothetical protein
VSHNKIKTQIKAMIGFLVTQPALRSAHYVGRAIKQFTIFKLPCGVCVIILVLKEYALGRHQRRRRTPRLTHQIAAKSISVRRRSICAGAIRKYDSEESKLN